MRSKSALFLNLFVCISLLFCSCGNKKNSNVSDSVDDNRKVVVVDNEDGVSGATEQSEHSLEEDRESKAPRESKVMDKIVENGKPTIIDFSATWCQPCRMMKPIFDKLADKYGDKINFVSIDVDKNPQLANKYQIQSIPAFIFLDEDGNESNRIVGAVPEEKIEEEIKSGAWY